VRVLLVVLALLLAAGAWWVLRDQATAPRAGRAATASDPAPKEREPQPEAQPSRRLVGKVTGDAPLAGVNVGAEWEGGTGEGRTADDGSYAIADPGTGAIRLRAEAPDGRVGFAEAAPGALEAPDIALLPAAGVTFVTEPVVAGARLELSKGVDDGWFWPFLTLRTGADGTAAVRLPLGRHSLRGFADGFGRATRTFDVEGGAQKVVVTFPAERRLQVTVVEKASGSPIAGVRLVVYQRSGGSYGVPEAMTDASGAAMVHGLAPDDKVALDVIPPGEVPQGERATFRRRRPVPDGVNAMTIEIGLPRTIEWEVLPGDLPPPADGSVIQLRPAPGAGVTPPPTGVMRKGKLVAGGWPFEIWVSCEALGPGGTIAKLSCAPEVLVGEPTKFELSRTLVVTLRRPDGTPAPAINVGLVNGGNNQIGQGASDDEGVVRMERLKAEVADLFVLGKSQYDRREMIGTVDLRKGDVRVTHTLTLEKRYEVTLLLDGKPFLPQGVALSVDGDYQVFGAGQDPEHGLLTGTFVPRSPLASLSLRALGFRNVSERVDVPAGDELLRHTFELDRGHECRIRIVGEQPKVVQLEFQQEGPSGWGTIDAKNWTPRAGQRETEDGWVYIGLDPGRYRMRTVREGYLWGPVEVGRGEAVLTLDFTRWEAIRGRVEIPDGYGYQEVQLTLRGDRVAEEPSMFRPGFPVSLEDGSFEVGIPGDRAVRLTARHPTLMCAAPVETTSGLDGVVLKLVLGPTLSFRLPGWEEKHAEFLKDPRWHLPRPFARVRLLRDGAEPVDLMALAKDPVWHAGGFAPGRYDVWIDVPEAVPQLLRNVDLKEGVNDLGDVPSLPGSRIRVRVLVKDGFAAPSVYVWATHVGEPSYARNTQTGGGTEEFVLPGLGSGRFDVYCGGLHLTRGLHQEIEVDGTNEVLLTLDLR